MLSVALVAPTMQAALIAPIEAPVTARSVTGWPPFGPAAITSNSASIAPHS